MEALESLMQAQQPGRYSLDMRNSQMHASQSVMQQNLAQQNAAGQMWGQAAAQTVGMRSLMREEARTALKAVQSGLAEEGVLMFRGAPLPENWRGAHYRSYAIAQVSSQWRITFGSDWSELSIMLWLSATTYSMDAASKVAETYLESINQRRLG